MAVICALLIVIFAIGSVSANENVDDLQVANETDTVSAGEDTLMKATDSSEVLGETGTFTQLQNLIDNNYGKTLTLDRNYEYDTAFGKNTGIVINSSITILGGGVTVNGLSASRLFNITGDHVTIDNLNFANGHIEGECSGGIFLSAEAEYFTVTNSRFDNNDNRGTDIKNAGAICSQASYSIIDNCTFTNNYASESGGAISFLTPTVHDCQVSNSYFENNTCWANGGAIESYCADGVFYNCTFINNRANQNTDDSYAGGGAIVIYSGASNTNITKCTFIDNWAFSGGAICSPHETCVNTTVSDCSFTNNVAGKTSGGAIYFNSANTTVKSCNFTDNSANTTGGAVYSNAQDSLVDACKFKRNMAADGNNIYASEGNTITNCGSDEFYVSDTGTGDGLRVGSPTSFANAINNVEDGGIIYLIGSFSNLYGRDFNKRVIIQGYENAAVIDLQGTSQRAFVVRGSNVVIRGVTFKNSLIPSDGGAIYWTGANGVVSDCNFINCSIYLIGDKNVLKGGAIYWNGANGVVCDSNFINCSASSYNGGNGGAIYWNGNGGTITGCTFQNNSAKGKNMNFFSGGAIYWIGECNIFNCSFSEYSAASICVEASSYTVHKVVNCTFTNVSSLAYFYIATYDSYGTKRQWTIEWDNIKYKNCPSPYFTLNPISGSGGTTTNYIRKVVYCSSTSNPTLDDGYIPAPLSVCTSLKAAIDNVINGGKIIVLNSISDNSGNFYFTINKNVTIVGGSADATIFAGIEVRSDGVTFENIKFKPRRSNLNLKLLSWTGANGIINNCTFDIDTTNGLEFITWQGSGGTISNCVFKSSISQYYIKNTGTLTLKNNTFYEVTASLDDKQVIYNGGDVALTGSFNAKTSGISFSGINISVSDMDNVSANVNNDGSLSATMIAPMPNQYTISLGNSDDNGNRFIYGSAPSARVNVIPLASSVEIPAIPDVMSGESYNVSISNYDNVTDLIANVLQENTVKAIAEVNKVGSDYIITIPGNLSAGSYVLNVTTVPTEGHISVSDTQNFAVLQSATNLTIPSIADIVYGNGATVLIADLVNVTEVGNQVSAYVNDADGNLVVGAVGVSGSVVSVGAVLGAGDYNLFVSTVPKNDRYTSVTKNQTFKVIPAIKDVGVGVVSPVVVYGGAVLVNVSAPVAGRYNVSVGGFWNASDFVVGEDKIINIYGLNAGDGYSVTVSCVEYDTQNYTVNSNTAGTVSVERAGSSVVITNVVDGVYNTTNVSVSYNIVNETVGAVTFLIKNGGVVVSERDIAGLESSLAVLDSGEYTLVIKNGQGTNHNASSDEHGFIVYRAGSSVVISNVVGGVYNTTGAIVTYTTDNETTVTFEIMKGTTTVASGAIASLNAELFKLGVGDYSIVIRNAKEGNFNASDSGSVAFAVGHASTSVTVPSIPNIMSGSQFIVVVSEFANISDISVKVVNGSDEIAVSHSFVDGKFSIVIPDTLYVGNYKLNVTTVPVDGNYSVMSVAQDFVVVGSGTNLTIPSIADIVYGNGATVLIADLVNVTDVGDQVSAYVNDADGNLVVGAVGVSGSVVSVGAVLGAGDYNLFVSTVPKNDRYTSVTKNQTFKVIPAIKDVGVGVVSPVVVYGGAVLVNVSAPVAGRYNVSVGGFWNASDFVVGEDKIINIYGLNAGDGYSVTVSCVEYDTQNYTVNSNTAGTVSVERAGSSVVITNVVDGVYNTTGSIVTYTTDNETTVTFEIMKGTTTVASGPIASLDAELFKLGGGDYTIVIRNTQEGNFNASDSGSVAFTVYRANSSVSIGTVTPGVYDTAVTNIPYTVVNTTAVTFTIWNGDNAVVVEDVAIASLNAELFKLGVGDYSIVIFNAQDNDFNASNSSSIPFTVDKAPSSITINVGQPQSYPRDVTIKYTTNSAITNISVTVKGQNTPAGTVNYNTPGKIIVSGLISGKYTIGITVEDANHTSKTEFADFEVLKPGSSVDLLPVSVMYGTSVIVTATNPRNASGVTAGLYSNNVLVKKLPVSNNFNINVDASDLNAGDYKLIATTIPYTGYKAQDYSCKVVVYKGQSFVFVDDAGVVYGESIIITANNLTNAGEVTAILYNGTTKLMDLVVESGIIINIDASNLTVGEYTLNVTTVPENPNYEPYTANATLTVTPANSTIDAIDSINVVYDGSCNVTVVTTSATGITAELYSGETSIAGHVSVNGDVITISAIALDVGVYSLNVTTMTDVNHIAVTKSTTVNVTKAGSSVIVPETTEVTYGDVKFVAVELLNASTVTVKLYGDEGEINGALTVDGDNITVDATNLDVGTYRMVVSAVVDGNHYPVTGNASVVVKCAGSSLVVPETGEVTYGDILEITARDLVNATGVTAILYNGEAEFSSAISIDGNTLIIYASILDAGEYTVTVSTITDENHDSASADVNITVAKADSVVEIPASVSVGLEDNVTVDIIRLENATGVIAEIYNGTVKIKDLVVDGNKIIVDSTDLEGGNYVLKVTTVTDKNHEASSDEAELEINVDSANLKVFVESVKTGQDVLVKVTVTSKATGSVSIKVNGRTKTVELVDAKGNATFTGLAVGTYAVSAKYYGDVNFDSCTATADFNVLNYNAKDLQALIDEAIANGESEVILEHDYLFDDDDQAVVINSSIKLNGGGHTVDANGVSTIFKVTGDNVTIENIILKNAKGDEGGAILWAGDNGVLSNAELINNTANNGGAIKWTGNNATIQDSTFTDNTAAGSGGAVLLEGDNATVIGSLFSGNEADIGGGIASTGDNLDVEDSKFTDNVADIGGGIFSSGDNATVRKSEFINNTAVTGAGIASSGDNLNVIGCEFTDNKADAGAGIVSDGDDATISDSEFRGNGAGTGAGAVLNGDDATVTDSEFTDNKAETGAGVVSNGKGTTIVDSDFTGNEAITGAGVVLNAENATVKGSSFINNTAESGSVIAIGDNATDANIIDITTEGNSDPEITRNPTIIVEIPESVKEGTDVTIKVTVNNAKGNVTFIIDGVEKETIGLDDAHTATYTVVNPAAGQHTYKVIYNGGSVVSEVLSAIEGLYEYAPGYREGKFTVKNLNFQDLQKLIDDAVASGNTTIVLSHDYVFESGNDTGAVVIPDGVTIDGKGHTISGSGESRIFDVVGDDVTIKNITLIGGKGENGGAIIWSGDNGILEDATLKDNEATNGGAIYWTGDGATIRDSEFINNTAANEGGAVLLAGDNATVENSTFIDNKAKTGAGIASNADNLNVKDSTFTDNTAETGGGISSTGSGATIIDSEFTGNDAKNGGGIASTGDMLTVEDSKFTDNTADFGAGISSSGDNATVKDSVFDGNVADIGGGIASTGDMLTVEGSTFTDNKAVIGAGIFSEGYGATIKDSVFDGNEAGTGAGVVLNGDDATVTGSEFTGNKAETGAGVVSNGKGTVINSSSFIGNEATIGAGVVLNGDDAIVEGSKFENNTATVGAGVVSNGDYTKIKDSEFIGNEADVGAGAVLNGYGATVEGSKFIGNTAGEGAGVVLNGDDATVTGSEFTGNKAEIGAGVVSNGKGTVINSSSFIGNEATIGAGVVLNGENATVGGNTTFKDNVAESGSAIAIGDNATDANFTDTIMEGNVDPETARNPTVIVDVEDVKVGNDVIIAVTVNNAEGNVTFTINGIEMVEIALDDSHKAVFTMLSPEVGIYNYKVVYNGGQVSGTSDVYGLGFKEGIVNVKDYNFQDLQKLIDDAVASGNTTIVLEHDYVFEDGVDTGAVNIPGGITIIGDGRTVSGSGLSTVFEVTGDDVTIKDITVTDGKGENGGAIVWSGDNGTLEGATFKDNNAANGGAIYWTGDGATIRDSEFIDNTATGSGAALLIEGNDASVYYSVFRGNDAHEGAGIASAGDYLNVADSVFEYNVADIGAGIASRGINANISGCEFTGNEAGVGAGIASAGDYLNVADSVFEYNVADIGAGIASRGINANISGCEFTGNEAGVGAGIASAGDMLTVDGSKFTDNKANTGAGIVVEGDCAGIYNSEFIGNEANIGAGVVLNGDDSIVQSSIFSDNTAVTGAGVVSNGDRTVIVDSEFTGNDAETGAGVVLNGDDALVSASIFSDNTAVTGAGVVSNGDRTVIVDSEFTGNDAETGAGVVLNGDDALVSASIFSDNTAVTGAGVVSNGYGTVIADSEFTGNEAVNGAGAVLNGDGAKIEDSVFAYNNADVGAGVIINGDGTEIIGSIFANNTAVSGAGVVSYGEGTIIIGCEFTGNVADVGAGAILNGDSAIVEDSLFAENSADVGAGLVLTGDNATVRGSTFANNTATEGAGIVSTGNGTSIVDSKFIGNKAEIGASVVLNGEGASVIGSEFIGNNATISGAAISVGPGVTGVVVENVTVANNTVNNHVDDRPVTYASFVTLVAVGDVMEGQPFDVTVYVSGGGNFAFDGSVTLTVGNFTYVVEDITTGMGIITVSGLSAGWYDIVVVYDNDTNRDESHATTPVGVLVKSTIAADDRIGGHNSSYDYNATFFDKYGQPLANTTVQFVVNGVIYDVNTDDNGTAYLTLGLDVGKYQVTAINPVTGDSVNRSIEIVSRLTGNHNLDIFYLDGTSFIVRVYGDDGKPAAGVSVKIVFVCKTYDIITDKDGYAVRTLGLAPGEYGVYASYAGDRTEGNVIVIKQVIHAKKTTIVKKSAKSAKIKITLKGKSVLKNKKIYIKFKGKKYSAKTNNKGVACFKLSKKMIKTLKKGKTYKYTIWYVKSHLNRYIKVVA